ncbi:MAG TPA: NACHT domain-containing protein [Trebonia sp.]|nr:NACHT domain-containing protein [Trebonia sp.]
MTFLATAAAKSGSHGQALHYGLYAAALLVAGGVLLWVAQQFFGSLITALGSKSADFLVAGLAGRGRVAGGRLRGYRRAVQRNYSSHALGFGGTEVIDIRTVYVPLRYDEAGRREDVYGRIRDESRSVVVGPAGAGKSLLLKNSMLIWAGNARMRPGHRGDRRLPVLVELHRCNDSEADIAQLVLEELDRNQVRRPKSFVDRAVRDGRLRLLLDGLDEVSKDRQQRVVTMIRDFARSNPACQIVVTCRDAVYYGQLTPEFPHVVRIAELDDASIRRLLGNWEDIDRPDVDNLVGTLRANPQLMHLARSPLLLTMIAYLYVSKFAKSGRSLPGSRVTFYETAITHLLGRDQFLARAGSLSAYDAGDKMAALQRIAATMQDSAAGGLGDRKEITQVEAIAATRSVLPDLNLDEGNAKPLFLEIVDRSQLMISLDQQRSSYSFRHLTLQEFLAARELADRPDDLLHGYMNDPDGWREVVKLWCGVTTRNSTTVVREVLAFGSLRHQVLALECLAEAKRIDEAFAAEIVDHFMGMLGVTGETAPVLVKGFGALAAAGGPRGQDVLGRLRGMADLAAPAADEDARRAAIAALSASGRVEAAEILALLAPHDEVARSALRGMGELAIPVLEHRASDGDVQAVDDLAFIGTPAAAESLSGLIAMELADDDSRAPVPTAAAWHLAELLAVPDVEEGLKASRFRVPDGVPSYDWIWKPFALSGTQDGPFGWIIGRVALVIDRQPNFAPRDARDIDQRIAIPLVGIKVGAQRVNTSKVDIAKASGMSSFRTAEAFFVTESRLPLSKRSEELCEKVIKGLSLPPAYATLMRRLPWPVQARLLAAVFKDRIRTTSSRDWLDIQHDPKPGGGLWGVFWALVLTTVPGAIVFATFWQVEVLRDAAHLSAPWAYTLAFCFFFGGLTLLVGGIVIGTATNADDGPAVWAFFMGVLSLPLGVVADVMVSGLILSQWIAAEVVVPLLVGVTLAEVLICQLAIHRDRRYGNPLRHCVRASNRFFSDRTSVIAK